jgi:hypothetical protein
MSAKGSDNTPGQASGETGELVLHSPGEVVVRPQDLPAGQPGGKTIHPRRPLPPVPDAAPNDSPKQEGGSDSQADGA